MHWREPEQDSGVVRHGQPARDPLQDVKASDLTVPVDDLVQPSLADPGSRGEPGLAHPDVLLHQAQQGPGVALAERMPDLGLAPFAVRHAHGLVPVGHLTVRIHLTVRYPLGDRIATARSARVNASPIRAAREMITMDGFTGPARRLVPDELEQVMRLARFRQAHPAVMVGAGRGWWQAVIPQANGEQVITRYTLGQLLDRLDELTGG